MVALNMVYLGAIGVVFVALFTPWRISPHGAWSAMLAGFSASLIGYVLGWAGLTTLDADLLSLVTGLVASLLVAGWHTGSGRLKPADPASSALVP